MANTESENFKSIYFLTADGSELSGTYFACTDQTVQPPILICPATGVKQTFYFPFASWLSFRGYPVLVFDYRGVGSSLHDTSLKSCPAKKQDWGEQDMPAALNWLLKQTGQERGILVGHSAGAQLVGLMPNHHCISNIVAISASSGYINNIRFPMKLAALFFVWIYIPLSIWFFGYLPAKKIGWGENLPQGVARQWARWCRSPGYVENDFGKSIKKNYFKEISCQVTLLYAEDDPLATIPNINDWLRLLTRAKKRVTPIKSDNSIIGHVGMFKRSHSQIWIQILDAIAGK